LADEFQERRQFFRVHFSTPVQYKSYADNRLKKIQPKDGVSKNISASGLLFNTQEPPQLSSILWMNLDLRTLSICQEIENRALVFKNGILGKVVRVEEDEKSNSGYDVGVCFLTQDQKDSDAVQKILEDVSLA